MSEQKQEEIVDKVMTTISEQLGVASNKISINSDLINDLGADSLDQVELVMRIEETFDIDIPDDAAEKMLTVKDIVEYIEENM